MADTAPIRLSAPELLLTGPDIRYLIGLNSNEWSEQACPDLKWEIPDIYKHGGVDGEWDSGSDIRQVFS